MNCALACTGSRQDLLVQALVAQLAHLESLQDLTLPETDSPQQQAALSADQPLITLREGVMSVLLEPELAGGAGPALADCLPEQRQ